MQEIRKQFQDNLAFSVIVGGLRADTKEILNDELKQYIRHHWTEVNYKKKYFFDRNNFVYNTEPACRAVVAMRNLKPEVIFSYFELLHYSFYGQNKDITTMNVLSKNAVKLEVNKEAFEEAFSSQEIIDETFNDFETARSMGVSGFPSLVLKDAERTIPVSRGYQALNALSSKLKVLLNL